MTTELHILNSSVPASYCLLRIHEADQSMKPVVSVETLKWLTKKLKNLPTPKIVFP